MSDLDRKMYSLDEVCDIIERERADERKTTAKLFINWLKGAKDKKTNEAILKEFLRKYGKGGTE